MSDTFFKNSFLFIVYLSVCALTIKIQNLELKKNIFIKFIIKVYLTISYDVEITRLTNKTKHLEYFFEIL